MARRRLEAALVAARLGAGTMRPGASFSNQDRSVRYPEGGGDRVIRNETFDTIDLLHTHRFEDIRDGIFSLQYSFDSNLLVLGYGDGGVEVLDAKTGKMEKEIRQHRSGGMAVTCVRFCPKDHNMCYATSSEGVIYSCNTNSGYHYTAVKEPNNEINCLDFCCDGTGFCTAGKDMNIRYYDTETEKCVSKYDGYSYISPPDEIRSGHARRVFALKFHPDNADVFLSGGWDDHVKVWDMRTKEGVERTITGPHICGDSLDVKDSQVLTGSWCADRALQIWDFGSGREIQEVDFPGDGEGGRGAFLYCAQFCDNDVILAGGSGTNSVKAVKATTGEVVGVSPLGHAVQALDSTLGGRLFSLGGAAPKVRLHAMT